MTDKLTPFLVVSTNARAGSEITVQGGSAVVLSRQADELGINRNVPR